MKLKKGDRVKVIAGSYKGSIADIAEVLPKQNKVILDGLNLAKKHLRPNQENPDGGIVDKAMPVDASNVMLYDSKAKSASRVGYKIEKGEKVRYFKKSGAVVKEEKK